MSTEAIFQDLPFVLKVEELASFLSIGRNKAYELIHSGRIRCIRIGTTYRISKDAVIEFVEKSSKNELF